MDIDISGLSDERRQELFDHCTRLWHEQTGQQILLDKGVPHLDPTYDRTFKWLMGVKNIDIAKTVFESMIFLTYKGLVNRKVRGFKGDSSHLDAMTEQLKRLPNDLCQFQALNPDVVATLQLLGPNSGQRSHDVGNSIDVTINECMGMLESDGDLGADAKNKLKEKLQELKLQIDSFKSTDGDMQTTANIVNHIGSLMIDIEMQRSKQNIIEARALQYGAIMLLSRHASELLPMILISICQWENTSCDTINDIFHIGVGQNSEKPVSISQMMINILEIKGVMSMSVSNWKSERKRIKGIFKTSLRQRYPGLIGNSESFKELWGLEDDSSDLASKRCQLRTAYEVLCFLRLAPLTPQLMGVGSDKDPNQDKVNDDLSEEQRIRLRTRIFNPIIRKAYNFMETNNDIPGSREQYLGVWSEQERIKKERDEAREKIKEIQRSAIENLVNSASLLKFVPDGKKAKVITGWAQKTFLAPQNLGIRKAAIDQIASKCNLGQNVVEILQKEYDRVVSGGDTTPGMQKDSAPGRGETSPGRSRQISQRSETELSLLHLSEDQATEVDALADNMASFLEKFEQPLVGNVVTHIEGLGYCLDILDEVANKLESKKFHPTKIEIFRRAINEIRRKKTYGL
jgi:hypothetical protein